MPRKYIDLKKPIKVLDAEPNQLCLLEGRVESLSGVTRSKTKSFFVVFSDNLANNKVYFKAMFYNMPFLHDGFSIGQSYRLLTRLTNDIGSLTVVNPSLEKSKKSRNSTEFIRFILLATSWGRTLLRISFIPLSTA